MCTKGGGDAVGPRRAVSSTDADVAGEKQPPGAAVGAAPPPGKEHLARSETTPNFTCPSDCASVTYSL